MKKLIPLAIVCFVMMGCEAAPLSKAKSANPAVTVGVLTEFDGIRLYSVHTGDSYVYVAVRMNELSASWDRSCGKGCWEHLDTTTLQVH